MAAAKTGMKLASSHNRSRLLQQSTAARRAGAATPARRACSTVVAAAGPEGKPELRERLPGELVHA